MPPGRRDIRCSRICHPFVIDRGLLPGQGFTGEISMLRRQAMAMGAASLGMGALGLGLTGASAQTLTQFRIGILGGENTQDRLARYDEFQKLLEAHLKMPVKLFPAADYAGVMQGIAAGQLEAAEFGASGFAGAWLDCKCVTPVVVPQEKDGSTYYYSVMVVRADSGIKTLADMKGHSLAWADPNSTSGYLIPSATLKTKGIDLKDGAYFTKTGFSGGHEQGVVAVLNKQYDAAVTWTSGQGEMSEGYTRGNLRSMVDRKMLKMPDINIIWQSGKIPNGPWAVRTALPAELRTSFTDFLLDLPKSHRKVYDDVEQGSGVGYAPATTELYQDMINLRLAERGANRS
jgi:phosphonate transport system substrate-binding protein